ncbi:hypothetical protein TNCT_122611 [Trichonephila clavata]|uniref:Uncharacterized protein n=1 Tax=Trichonephila clavata TaxID=2740835 RepID=A0A8X6J7E6_TRICU|nr:hypothetical protein TNCT_122611 [Trichonephila clavata]
MSPHNDSADATFYDFAVCMNLYTSQNYVFDFELFMSALGFGLMYYWDAAINRQNNFGNVDSLFCIGFVCLSIITLQDSQNLPG